jgi:nicotinamidase-related amidase
MKPALLIIDMQRVSYSGYSAESMDRAAGIINRAAELFRSAGFPVIWIQQDNGGSAVPGTREFELIGSLRPELSEKRIVKRYENSFIKTGLAGYLEEQKADTPIITGYCAEYCVLSTYRGARELDMVPLLLRGGIAGGVEENIRFVENLCEGLSPAALLKMFELFRAPLR